MSDKGITLEGLAAAVDALRQELATWKALAHKQDQLSADQITATQSGATAAKISQIAVNTAAIQSLAAQVAGQISLEYVTTLPATGEPLTLYLVPQGDGTAPNFCNEYLWVNNAWELIGTTGAMANNGELSIQVNGVTVGTFTANQATNAAVNIAVPTNTNQLVNGAGYVDTAALQAALALKQNSLNATQLEAVNSGITAAGVQQIADNATAISGKQDALTTAQQAAVDSGATAAKIDQIASNASAIVSLTSSKQDSLSVTQLAAVNSGVTAAAVQQISTNADAIATKAADNSVVHLAGTETITGNKTFTGAVVTHHITPETDGTYSLGSSSYQWSSVYAQSYYYNGTAWGLDKANTWTQNQIIASSNDKCYLVKDTVYELGQTYSNGEHLGGLTIHDKNGAVVGFLDIVDRSYGNMEMRIRVQQKFDPNSNNRSTSGTTLYNELTLGITPTKTNYIGFNADLWGGNTYNLGTSTNKWTTLNGINPGALCLQNFNARITLDTTNWDMTGKFGADANFWTPTVNGWLTVLITGTPGTGWVQLSQADGLGQFSVCLSTGYAWATIPVIANARCKICLLCSTVASAKFYPCLGNV